MPQPVIFRPTIRTLACAFAAAGVLVWSGPEGRARTQAAAAAPVVFAALGDTGTGARAQYEVARAMGRARRDVPFDMVLLLGDNTYNARTAKDLPQAYERDFKRPYADLLARGVTFYAVLGNHDPPEERTFPPFHMKGRRYYSFVRGPVLFVGLDSNRMDADQLAWLDRQLARPLRWKVVYMHHPPYSAGRKHGSDLKLRVQLEPLLVERGVQVVFSAHEHVYLRTKPQSGVTYFVCGSGGRVRIGDLAPSRMTAKGFDRDNAFFLGAIEGDHLRFRVLSRTGAVVDTGTILAPLVPPPAPEPPEQPDPDPPVPLPDSPAPPCVPADVRGDAPATRVVVCFPP